MIAKFNGTCCYCSKPIKAKVDEYDPDSKRSFHRDCRDSGKPGPDAYRLADELGYFEFSSDMDTDRLLRHLRPPDRSVAAGRPAAEALPRRNANLFGE